MIFSTPSPDGTYAIGEPERSAMVSALHAYRFETEQYLRTSGFTPCHPACEHCAPKAAHFETMRASLSERRDTIVAALTALNEGPCACGMRGHEHWAGDHK